jgi:DNA-binding NarL/FixJ family response regulator
MKKIRLLVIEENRLLREGLVSLIGDQPDIKVVAALGRGENISAGVRRLKPHVILVDMDLRSQDSLRVVESVKGEFPQVKVILMDLVPGKADMAHYVKAGVSGFLVEDATFQDCLRTVRSVAKGTDVLPPALTGSLFSEIVNHAVIGAKASLIESANLTRREREVIELIAQGLSNKEIAQRLNIATYTVKSHVHNILEKLSLDTRLQIASYAHAERKSKPPG